MRLLKLGAVLLWGTAVFLITLIATGTFDPQPVGAKVWSQSLQTIAIPAKTQKMTWLDERIPKQSFSVRLTAVLTAGDLDSGYGLALGNDDNALIIALSPLGYATIEQNGQTLLPWQPWPHVKTGNGCNEIWVEWVDEQLMVRVNRELLWAGEVEMPAGNLGVYGESFVDTAVVEFREIELYGD